jgi:hypothetical protein
MTSFKPGDTVLLEWTIYEVTEDSDKTTLRCRRNDGHRSSDYHWCSPDDVVSLNPGFFKPEKTYRPSSKPVKWYWPFF